MKATAHVSVVEYGGHLYPSGSDTPIPAHAVLERTYNRTTLHYGDIVVDAGGRPFHVQSTRDEFDGLEFLVATPVGEKGALHYHLEELEGPLTVVYRQGLPEQISVA